MTILVITTGGTIGAMPHCDALHPPCDCALPKDGNDLVRAHIDAHFRKDYALRCMTMELQPSAFIDEVYRQNLADVIARAEETNILVTHGTDAILDTATYLFNDALINDKLACKTIILTGAMVPLANANMSEGHQNLRFALRALSTANANLKGVNIVLSDFDNKNVWRPRLYQFQPNRFQKVYDANPRFNRLIATGGGDLSALMVKVANLT